MRGRKSAGPRTAIALEDTRDERALIQQHQLVAEVRRGAALLREFPQQPAPPALVGADGSARGMRWLGERQAGGLKYATRAAGTPDLRRERVEDRENLLRRVTHAAGDRERPLPPAPILVLYDSLDQSIPRREVAVERHHRHVGLRHDAVDADGADALVNK